MRRAAFVAALFLLAWGGSARAAGDVMDDVQNFLTYSAFDGAFRDFAGLLERAGEGTLFVDRVDLFPQRIVRRLEEALISGRTQRLGDSERAYEVRCRVIATTPRPCAISALNMIEAPEVGDTADVNHANHSKMHDLDQTAW